MKRFFCTVCQKIKHVRIIPASVDTPNATNPTDRIGQCTWHTVGHVYPTRLIPKVKKEIKTVTLQVSKKARRG